MALLSNQKFIQFQKSLLIDPFSCPIVASMPESSGEWTRFIRLIIHNRLPSLFYHFIVCKNCQKKIPKKIYISLSQKYYNLVYSYIQRKILKKKIDKKLRQTKIALFELKDCGQINKIFAHYYEAKFDLDVFGSEKDFPHVYAILKRWGYTCFRGRSKSGLVEQYEFVSDDFVSSLIPIEFIYTLFSSHLNRFQPSKSRFYLINKWLADKLHSQKPGLRTLNIYDDFFLRILLYFFDDSCMSLRSLYDIYIILSTSIHSWKKIEKISKKYGVYDIVLFVTLLSINMYGGKEDVFYKLPPAPLSVKLALYIVEIYEDLYNPLISVEIVHDSQKNSRLFSMISGLLVHDKMQSKIFFFCSPYRLSYLFFISIKVFCLKLISYIYF